MLVLVREVFAALFRIDDLAADDADREWIATIRGGAVMGPVADVLRAIGRRTLGVRYAGRGTENQADQQQGLTKTK